MVRWRLWKCVSILTILYDFLEMKDFQIPITLRRHLLKVYNETFLSTFQPLWWLLWWWWQRRWATLEEKKSFSSERPALMLLLCKSLDRTLWLWKFGFLRHAMDWIQRRFWIRSNHIRPSSLLSSSRFPEMSKKVLLSFLLLRTKFSNAQWLKITPKNLMNSAPKLHLYIKMSKN